MSTIRHRAAIAAVLAALALLAGAPTTSAMGPIAGRPLALAAVGPAGVQGCELLPDPRFPIELGSAVAGTLTKTVAMEKELFRCQAAAGGGQKIRDLETFIEIVQTQTGKLVSISILLNTCDRAFPAGTVKCTFTPMPVGAIVTNPLEGCDIATASFPNDPVEMNVVANGRTIKTIKLDKEWYRCTDGQRELYTFSEFIEAVELQNGAPTGFKTTLTRNFGIVCLKDVQKGVLQSCRRFRTG